MGEDVYHKLAKVLDTLPNGFPSTESGVEIRLLKKIFKPDEAELFCDLRLGFETAEQVAERTGRPLEGLEEKLTAMRERGQIFGVKLGDTRVFKMVPWAFGIYELQLPHLDKEFVELNEQFYESFGKQFFSATPQLMQTLPIEEEISVEQEALPYEKVSTLIDSCESFLVNECVCKKEQSLLDNPCDRPLEVCLALAPVPGVFADSPTGRVITKDEAYQLLAECEKNGLVHLTVINSHYYAEIDPDACPDCGICADDRCQVNAIAESEDASYQVVEEKCIGCGLCITACPTDAIKMVRRPEQQLVPPPLGEVEWFKERGRIRGVDFSRYE